MGIRPRLAALYSRRTASTVVAIFTIGLVLLVGVEVAMYGGSFSAGLLLLFVAAGALLLAGIVYQGCALSVLGAPLLRPFAAATWPERGLWIVGMVLAVCGLVAGATDHWYTWTELGFLGLLLTLLAQLLLIRRLAPTGGKPG